tara:strand:- start:964 stop:1158 length:195 start_codon:yes stop_codon:yes gene_type:complete
VEIDQRLIQLEKGIEILEDLNAILYNSDNKELLQHSHIIQKELEKQFQEIQSIFENRLKKTNLS